MLSSPRRRVWSLVSATYVVATLVTHVLWTGHLNLTAETLALAVIVPAVQVAAIEALNRLWRPPWF